MELGLQFLWPNVYDVRSWPLYIFVSDRLRSSRASVYVMGRLHHAWLNITEPQALAARPVRP